MSDKNIGNKVFSQSSIQYKQTWLFAFIWNAMTWFAIIKGGENILRAFEENPVFYFFALFPFIGLWLVFSAIRQTWAWYKFKRTPVVLDPFPGQVGGVFAAYLDLPISPNTVEHAVLTLTCVHRYLQRTSDGKSSWREQPVWQDHVSIKPDNFGQHIRLNFSFTPPVDLPESEDESDDYHLWRLHVRLPLSGIDYDRVFIVPLKLADEKTLATNKRYKTRTSPTIDHQDTAVGAIPQISKTAEGTQFYYGYGRSKGMAIALMVFGIVLSVFAYYFFRGFLDFLPVTTTLMEAFVGFIALALFLLGIFLISNSLMIEVSLMGIRKQQRIFGFLLEEMTDADKIVDIVVEKNASSTSGNTARVWFRLKLVTGDSQDVEVGDSLEGDSYAQEIRKRMITALGVTWRPAKIQSVTEKKKRQIPAWFKSLRPLTKLLSYTLPIALVYDLREFIVKLFNFLY